MNPLFVYRHRFTVDDDSKKEPSYYPEPKGMIIPDQSMNNPKLYDFHGLMQSDVSRLFAAVASNDLPLQKALSDRMSLGSVASSSHLDPNMTEDQMFESTPSRYAQTPSELVVQAEQISSVIDVGNIETSEDTSSNESISFEGNENSES